jgi:DNA-directed RNA polymerase subunit omega
VNSEYVKQAMTKVVNPNVLVNLISRRVRQLTSGGGGSSRPLIDAPVGAGTADLALLELIDGKMSFEISSATEEEAQPAKKRRR